MGIVYAIDMSKMRPMSAEEWDMATQRLAGEIERAWARAGSGRREPAGEPRAHLDDPSPPEGDLLHAALPEQRDILQVKERARRAGLALLIGVIAVLLGRRRRVDSARLQPVRSAP
jgi:hypothetical protein